MAYAADTSISMIQLKITSLRALHNKDVRTWLKEMNCNPQNIYQLPARIAPPLFETLFQTDKISDGLAGILSKGNFVIINGEKCLLSYDAVTINANCLGRTLSCLNMELTDITDITTPYFPSVKIERRIENDVCIKGDLSSIIETLKLFQCKIDHNSYDKLQNAKKEDAKKKLRESEYSKDASNDYLEKSNNCIKRQSFSRSLSMDTGISSRPMIVNAQGTTQREVSQPEKDPIEPTNSSIAPNEGPKIEETKSAPHENVLDDYKNKSNINSISNSQNANKYIQIKEQQLESHNSCATNENINVLPGKNEKELPTVVPAVIPPNLSSQDTKNENVISNLTTIMWTFLNKYHKDKLEKTCGMANLQMLNARISNFGANAFDETLKLSLESLIKTLNIRVMPVKLESFEENGETSVITGYISSICKVVFSENISYYNNQKELIIAGCTHDLKTAFDKLAVLSHFYGNYKSQEYLKYDETITNIYSTSKPLKMPLIISERNQVFWRQFASRDKFVDITIKTSDLFKEEVEVIVNSAVSDMKFISGISRHLLKVAGEQIQEDSRKRVHEHGGEIMVTKNIVTRAGNLPFKHIIHAVSPTKAKCDNENELIHLLKNTFINIFNRADELQVTSIAMPAIGTGYGDITMEMVAQAYETSVTKYVDEKNNATSTLRDIRLILLESGFVNEMRGYYAHLANKNTFYSIERPNAPNNDASSFQTSNQQPNIISLDTTNKGNQLKKNCDNCEDLIRDEEKSYTKPCGHNNCQKCFKNDFVCLKCNKEECGICCEKSNYAEITLMKKCGHFLCKSCAKSWKMTQKCLKCEHFHKKWINRQPPGNMSLYFNEFEKYEHFTERGKITIHYNFENERDRQSGDHHSNKPYKENYLFHYLPNNDIGKRLLVLFRKAFDAGLLFSSRGDSITCTIDGINRSSYVSPSYRYPNKDIMKQIEEELESIGIKNLHTNTNVKIMTD